MDAPDPAAFDDLDEVLARSGPVAAVDNLIARLERDGPPRALLDALLLKARLDLGMPPVLLGPLAEIAEPARSQYEDRYVEALRAVGRRLLDAGEIPAAWPYYRTIGEVAPVAEAIEAYAPAEGDERLGQVVEVAFNQAAHPRKGFELILEHYGTCSAITAYESLPDDEATRVGCAERLIRQLHDHLAANLRDEIARRGQPMPRAGTPIPELCSGRDWLFADDAYHLDVSHLGAVVRIAAIAVDPTALDLAVELAEYGRRLSPRHATHCEPPFERPYDDHAAYFNALLGRDVDATVAVFRAKVGPPGDDADPTPAQVLIRLLARLGRLDEAIDLAAGHLAGLPDSALICPSLAALCDRAGRPDRLADANRAAGDLVGYAAALLQRAATPDSGPQRTPAR